MRIWRVLHVYYGALRNTGKYEANTMKIHGDTLFRVKYNKIHNNTQIIHRKYVYLYNTLEIHRNTSKYEVYRIHPQFV